MTPTMTPIQAFALSIHAKATALSKGNLTDSQMSRLKESISDDIKKYTNFIPHRVSQAARDSADTLQSPVDLSQMTWHDQRRFDPGRRLFIVEHKRPVNALRDECINAASRDEVEKILAERLVAAWITRAENNMLNERGFRFNRPDPCDAYNQAGIVLPKTHRGRDV
jgi:hypothetical protein